MNNNPLRYVDPTGHIAMPPTIWGGPADPPLEYNGRLAAEYALRHAMDDNLEEYVRYPDDDCANFTSQALKAGGQEINDRWYPYSVAWRWTYGEEGLYNYLNDPLEQGGLETNASVLLSPSGEWEIGEFPRQIRPGDVVFYHQEGYTDASYYNHVAIVVGWGPENIKDQDAFLNAHGGEYPAHNNRSGTLIPYVAHHTPGGKGSVSPIHPTKVDTQEYVIFHMRAYYKLYTSLNQEQGQ